MDEGGAVLDAVAGGGVDGGDLAGDGGADFGVGVGGEVAAGGGVAVELEVEAGGDEEAGDEEEEEEGAESFQAAFAGGEGDGFASCGTELAHD